MASHPQVVILEYRVEVEIEEDNHFSYVVKKDFLEKALKKLPHERGPEGQGSVSVCTVVALQA